jgi:hypothetical protein
MPRLKPVQHEQAIEQLNAGQRLHLVADAFAIFELFNSYEDVTMRQTARQTIHVVVAQWLQHSVRIGISCVIIYKIDSLQ